MSVTIDGHINLTDVPLLNPLVKLLSLYVCILGDAVWLPGQELPQSPWDLVRKRLSQRITIHLKGGLCSRFIRSLQTKACFTLLSLLSNSYFKM